MSAIVRSAVALFLSASLATFGVGCVTEETIDEDLEEVDVDAEDELDEEELELAEESDEAAQVELSNLAEPADRIDAHTPETSHRWINKRNMHPRAGRLSTPHPEVAEELVNELSDKVRDAGAIEAGGIAAEKLFDKDLIDVSIPTNDYVSQEVLHKIKCHSEGGLWASGVCILPPAA